MAVLFHAVVIPTVAFDREGALLPPFIIEQIRQREEREREKNRDVQPRLELPLNPNRPPPKRTDDEDDRDRGVIILEIG